MRVLTFFRSSPPQPPPVEGKVQVLVHEELVLLVFTTVGLFNVTAGDVLLVMLGLLKVGSGMVVVVSPETLEGVVVVALMTSERIRDDKRRFESIEVCSTSIPFRRSLFSNSCLDENFY